MYHLRHKNYKNEHLNNTPENRVLKIKNCPFKIIKRF